jgi:hypothetical protein
LARLPHAREVPPQFQARLAPQTEARWRRGGHGGSGYTGVRRLRPTRRRLRSVARPLLVLCRTAMLRLRRIFELMAFHKQSLFRV